MKNVSFKSIANAPTLRIVFFLSYVLMSTSSVKAMSASNHVTSTHFSTFSKEKRQMHRIESTSIFAKEKMTKTKGEVATEAVAVVLLIVAGVFFLGLLGLGLSCGQGFLAISCRNSAFVIGASIVGLCLVILGIRKALRKKK